MRTAATPSGPVEVVLRDEAGGRWLRFQNPVRVLCARRLNEVLPALTAIETAVERDGLHAAGFLSYEAAPAFDPALTTRPPDDFPLLWFGLFPPPEVMPWPSPDAPAPVEAPDWTPDLSREDHARAVDVIRDHIRRGDTYQVNFTFRLRAALTEDPWRFFLRLAAPPHPPHAAFVRTGEWAVCSASPELFFERDGDLLRSRPMKGTAARGLFPARDEARAAALRQSEKNRAENLMIADMVRNDLGRIARAGTVTTPRLCDVERHPTVWQMTSTVEARSDASTTEVLSALFPPASITGAPRRRTMQLIAGLETSPRHVYTGAVGFIAPGRRASFNVAIRTVLIHQPTGRATYGVGGGIVWDSTATDEYEECRTKARVLEPAPGPFDLLETTRWDPAAGFALLELHLTRLAASAAYFGRPFNADAVRARLEALAATLAPRPHRVRWRVDAEGRIKCEAEPWTPSPSPRRLAVARHPVNASDVFLYHKTTSRRVYDEARAAHPEADDVILWNERGELTETTIANLVLELDGRCFTPPVECGLLGGTYRAAMLADGRVTERVLTREDLRRATRIRAVNSLRGEGGAVLIA